MKKTTKTASKRFVTMSIPGGDWFVYDTLRGGVGRAVRCTSRLDAVEKARLANEKK